MAGYNKRKLIHKRARAYNSDDSENNDAVPASGVENSKKSRSFTGNEVRVEQFSEGEDDVIQPGITRFSEGCRAFSRAMKKILKSKIPDDALGPVLSGRKGLIALKLAKEESNLRGGANRKKESHLIGEKGHVRPENFLDSHEKFLLGIATKGAVKFFNAVNKAQSAQKGLNPLRSRDAKAIRKQRKQTFFSELAKPTDETGRRNNNGEPTWAPLRDNYMLTSSKMKKWDNNQGNEVADNGGDAALDGSSDEE